ncbi:hypothetical protein KCP73_19295 [Salmonella enterica subsp. enterica]|nr:hypothetical protein KCP73_19295 [Salmonella enterica subsp. enterica]
MTRGTAKRRFRSGGKREWHGKRGVISDIIAGASVWWRMRSLVLFTILGSPLWNMPVG